MQPHADTHVFVHLVTRPSPMDFRLFLLRHGPLLRVLFRCTVRLLLPSKLVKHGWLTITVALGISSGSSATGSPRRTRHSRRGQLECRRRRTRDAVRRPRPYSPPNVMRCTTPASKRIAMPAMAPASARTRVAHGPSTRTAPSHIRNDSPTAGSTLRIGAGRAPRRHRTTTAQFAARSPTRALESRDH